MRVEGGAILGFGCSFRCEIVEEGMSYVHYTFNVFDLFHDHIKCQVQKNENQIKQTVLTF